MTKNPNPGQKYFNHCSTGRAAEVIALLESGVDPESRDKYKLTGLIWAGRKGRIEVADALLRFGADINATDLTGRTSLTHAVAYKRLDFVRFLIEKGADLNPIDMHHWTPLDLAESNLDPKMVELLQSRNATSARKRVS